MLTRSPYWQQEAPAEIAKEATLIEVEGANENVKLTLADALNHTFHELDTMIDSSEYREELSSLSHQGKAKAKSNAGKAKELPARAHTNSIDEGESAGALAAAAGDDKDKISTADAIELFQKLLTMSGKKDGEGGTAGDKAVVEEEKPAPTVGRQRVPSTCVSGVDPTTGRQQCLLPDHPVHAGCTSVVCVLVERDVVVANAGDSRAVLQRKNEVKALSYDHKPEHAIETNRISKAGGFVNQFGRVNGNLNLSRSIGDLKYKQNCDYGAADQIITAQPDIISTTLEEDDEFIILGCDGIWDCLTNEEACR